MSYVMLIPEDWKPTAENVNELPEPVRQYVHAVETLCDPAGIVAENRLMRDEWERAMIRLSRTTYYED